MDKGLELILLVAEKTAPLRQYLMIQTLLRWDLYQDEDHHSKLKLLEKLNRQI